MWQKKYLNKDQLMGFDRYKVRIEVCEAIIVASS